jgi:hypothetical protein
MASPEEVSHQQDLLAAYRRTLAQYLKRQATLGEAFTPPEVSNGITEARANIQRIKQILRAWHVPVEDSPNDDENIPSVPKQPKASTRVVGQRITDISTYFRDRNSQLTEISRLLAHPATRIVSVIGRGGIGKTAIVSKILGDLESRKWPHTDEEIPVNSILYLSTRTKGISLERIFIDCAEIFGGQSGESLLAIWTNPQLGNQDKVNRLFDMFKDDLNVILLDNIEDLLDENQQIKDEALHTFFEVSLRRSHNVRLLVTSRKPLAFSMETMRFNKHVPIDEGLPEQDGIKMLRELDSNGEYGLRDAHRTILRQAVRKVYGIPRALELIASILANNPFLSLEKLLQQELFKRGGLVEALVREQYERLDQDSRRVMEALAIFGSPVPIEAIATLLKPFPLEKPIPQVLKQLIQMHSVYYNRMDGLVWLHPIDRDYIYSQIPVSEDI